MAFTPNSGCFQSQTMHERTNIFSLTVSSCPQRYRKRHTVGMMESKTLITFPTSLKISPRCIIHKKKFSLKRKPNRLEIRKKIPGQNVKFIFQRCQQGRTAVCLLLWCDMVSAELSAEPAGWHGACADIWEHVSLSSLYQHVHWVTFAHAISRYSLAVQDGCKNCS